MRYHFISITEPVRHVKEYHTMYYSGIPRHTKSKQVQRISSILAQKCIVAMSLIWPIKFNSYLYQALIPNMNSSDTLTSSRCSR